MEVADRIALRAEGRKEILPPETLKLTRKQQVRSARSAGFREYKLLPFRRFKYDNS